jgi:hypothetical protein
MGVIALLDAFYFHLVPSLRGSALSTKGDSGFAAADFSAI